ncbi:MAG TPA: MBL fold metallo-hydrolase [Caulobacteraceae bacterium]|nr:MBL fold metallo-hydrolase [Caulobacteraceae bacterium]
MILAGDGAYVIDCGNGVGRQLALAGVPFSALRAIFLTHHHSDHNADIGMLPLLAWEATLASPLTLVGPPPLAKMLRLFGEMYAPDIAWRTADEGRAPFADHVEVREIDRPGLVYEDGYVRVTATLVDHPPVVPAFAFRFDLADRAIVLSGDTAPCERLIALAKGAQVLVHEVMHVPSLEGLLAGEAVAPHLREHLLAAHTSADDVGRIAAAAGVERLVLTHFVPGGEPAVPDEVWRGGAQAGFAGEVIVGADLMEL